jgi:hypothetical protein
MKRIVDQEHSPDSPEHFLAELVRATPRLEPPPLQQQRILLGVKGATMGKRRRPWAAFGVAVFVLAGATLAAAAVGHLRAMNSPTPAPLPSTTASAAPMLSPQAASTRREVGSADDPAPAEAPMIAPAASSPLERPSVRLRATAPFKDGEDPAPVLEAIRALRYNGDPSRASALLAQYLKVHPHGVLAEDASALSIEAAIARHDPRSAGDLARHYLTQFPGGRYRAFATQTLQTAAP